MTVTSRRSEVLLERRGPHVGQRAGARVALGARRGEVPAAVAARAPSRCRSARGAAASSPSAAASAATSPSTTTSSSRGDAPEQQVAHRAADEMHAARARRRPSSRRRPQARPPRRSSRSSIATVSRLRRSRRVTRRSDAIARPSVYHRSRDPIAPPRAGAGAARARGRGRSCSLVARRWCCSAARATSPTRTSRSSRRPRARRPRAGSRAGQPHPADDGFEWPVYGYTKARTHHLPLDGHAAPAVSRRRGRTAARCCSSSRPVAVRAHALPAEEQRRAVRALAAHRASRAGSASSARSRRPRRRAATASSTPSLLQRGQRHRRPAASSRCRRRTGARCWSRKLPSRAESSPLLDRGRLYFGTEDGTVYALRASDGEVRWTLQGDRRRQGRDRARRRQALLRRLRRQVHAIRRADGTQGLGEAPRRRRLLGLGAGNFYSSAAVAYGRVYIGSTNGDVYSFVGDERQARLAQAAPATTSTPRRPSARCPAGSRRSTSAPTTGSFYALDARTGKPRWVRALGDEDLRRGDDHRRPRLRLRPRHAARRGRSARSTGATVWKTRRGAFNPVISDGRRIYFAGFTSLFALDHVGRPFDSATRGTADEGRDERRGARGAQRARRRARGAQGQDGAAAQDRPPGGAAQALPRAARPRATSASSPARRRATGATSSARRPATSATSPASAPRAGSRAPPSPGSRSRARQARTAMPAAARCAFASRTRNVP